MSEVDYTDDNPHCENSLVYSPVKLQRISEYEQGIGCPVLSQLTKTTNRQSDQQNFPSHDDDRNATVFVSYHSCLSESPQPCDSYNVNEKLKVIERLLLEYRHCRRSRKKAEKSLASTNDPSTPKEHIDELKCAQRRTNLIQWKLRELAILDGGLVNGM
jgi:hypothetical protein